MACAVCYVIGREKKKLSVGGGEEGSSVEFKDHLIECRIDFTGMDRHETRRSQWALGNEYFVSIKHECGPPVRLRRRTFHR